MNILKTIKFISQHQTSRCHTRTLLHKAIHKTPEWDSDTILHHVWRPSRTTRLRPHAFKNNCINCTWYLSSELIWLLKILIMNNNSNDNNTIIRNSRNYIQLYQDYLIGTFGTIMLYHAFEDDINKMTEILHLGVIISSCTTVTVHTEYKCM